MGEENTTVEEIRNEVTEEIEAEEQDQTSSCGFKQMAGVAAITTVMLGAGYGLFKLGKIAVGKAKTAYAEHKRKEELLEDFDDDDEDFEVDEEKPKK